MEKNYYLPPFRSVAIGVILLIMGLVFTFMGVDFSSSVWANLQSVLLNFHGVFDFILSLVMLLFKAGFMVGGYFYIKYARSVIRAKIDSKGFYYQIIPKGNKYDKIAIDAHPLQYVPFGQIENIVYRKSFWGGSQLDLCLASGKVRLIALDTLKDKDKQDIAATIKLELDKRQVKRRHS